MLTGEMLIDGIGVRGTAGEIHAYDPATGEVVPPTFGAGDAADVERACESAWSVFDRYRDTSLDARAAFLEAIAAEIAACGEGLIERAMIETGLPRARLQGERDRTVGQLRLFARVVRDGDFLEPRIDAAMPDRRPQPRGDYRQRHIAVGPVAVFGASNFPLAFSVAGGDTAAA
ncbi:MAG: aldehyde dehydrogenase family protein, partial [Gammaproteobacteria bacterium]|nr:aldehyde dehydrogenase family protein [Gammaproteobacteria bacterium]